MMGVVNKHTLYNVGNTEFIYRLKRLQYDQYFFWIY